MNTIIIFGDKKDTSIKDTLINTLKKNNVVNSINLYNAFSVGKGIPINIVHTNCIKHIGIENAIVIINSSAKVNNIKKIDKSCRVIINSDNSKGISKLIKFGANIFTCGFSSKDYITFSSRNDDSAVVSLQRSIRLSKDIACDPFETPCQIKSEMSDYTILASTLALILVGDISEEKCSEKPKYLIS